MELSILDIVVLVAGALVVLVIVGPHLPVWFVFALLVGTAYYRLTHLVLDGPSLERAMSIVLLSTIAALLWWKSLRGTERRK